MNRHTKLHNILIFLLALCAFTGFILEYIWHRDTGIVSLYILSEFFCAGTLIPLGGFLFLLSTSRQDQFIKDSFLEKFMNEKERQGRIFTLRSKLVGFVWLLFGLMVITGLLYSSFK